MKNIQIKQLPSGEIREFELKEDHLKQLTDNELELLKSKETIDIYNNPDHWCKIGVWLQVKNNIFYEANGSKSYFNPCKEIKLNTNGNYWESNPWAQIYYSTNPCSTIKINNDFYGHTSSSTIYFKIKKNV